MIPSDRTPLLTEIAPSIFLVEGQKHGQFPFSHSILIRDEVTALIDTGCGIERLRHLKEQYPLDLVVNSHAHPDHISGNWLFPNVPLLVPRQSFEYTGNIQEMSERLTSSEVDGSDVGLAATWREYVREATGFRDALPTDHYDEGHRFQLGSVELLALHCPGHTHDTYCLIEPQQRVLFSFDIDLTPFGPWYGHPDSDIAQFEASILRLRDLKPRMVVSSHRGIITDNLEERFQEYLDVFAQRDADILEFLSEPRTLEETIDRPLIYRDFPYAEDLLRLWQRNMLLKHLDRLEEQGLVQKTAAGYRRS